MSPERNLAVQTAVIARARAFVGTYGGYSYLAPFCGVPSLAFYSERSFKVHHLHVAQQIFARLGGASLVPLDVASRAARAPAVGEPRHRAMKILFVWDSPEYLRFYDSAIEECAARGHDVAIAVINTSDKKPVGLEGLQAYADRVRVLGVVPEHDGSLGLDRARPARHHGFRSLSAPALRGCDERCARA